jgi:uncharacterized membrane protein
MVSDPGHNRLRKDLLSGVAFFLPFVLLAVVCYGIARTLYGTALWLAGTLAAVGVRGTLASVLAVSGALVAVPVVLVGTGALLRHRYGDAVVGAVDRVIERIPGVGPIYVELRRSRQLVAGDGASAFREVVAVEFSDGIDMLGFVVGREGGADWTSTAENRVTVYVPLSPNPTVGGHLLAVREARVRETELSVRAALAILVTVGTSDPDVSDPPLAGLYHDAEDVRQESATHE